MATPPRGVTLWMGAVEACQTPQKWGPKPPSGQGPKPTLLAAPPRSRARKFPRRAGAPQVGGISPPRQNPEFTDFRVPWPEPHKMAKFTILVGTELGWFHMDPEKWPIW